MESKHRPTEGDIEGLSITIREYQKVFAESYKAGFN